MTIQSPVFLLVVILVIIRDRCTPPNLGPNPVGLLRSLSGLGRERSLFRTILRRVIVTSSMFPPPCSFPCCVVSALYCPRFLVIFNAPAFENSRGMNSSLGKIPKLHNRVT